MRPLRQRPGILLLEVVLGIAVFIIFLGATGLVLLNGEQSTKAAGDRIRATEYARQVLEAARSIRETNFSSLVAGTYGVRISPITNQWELYGTQTVGTGGYVTTLTIVPMSSDQVLAIANTTWQIAPNRPGTLKLSTLISNWERTQPVGNWSNMVLSGSYISGGNPLYNDMAVSGNYAYVTSEITGNGAGLYIFSIVDPAHPSQAASFNLGAAGYGIGIRGTTLYVLTGDATTELRAYDISNPISPSLLASYDLPGSGAAKALQIDGNRLFIGATGLAPMAYVPIQSLRDHWRGRLVPVAEAMPCVVDEQTGQCLSSSSGAGGASSTSVSSSSAASASSVSSPTGNDFFGFDISTPSVLNYRGSLYANGVNGISVTGTSAYLASPYDTAELQVVNVSQLGSMSFASKSAGGAGAGGYNLSDGTQDALTTGVAGNYLLLGRDKGSIQELVLFDISGGSFPVGGPWYHEASGAVMRVAMDPTACYGFVADNSHNKTLQIVKVRDYSLSELKTWDAPANNGARGMLYDAATDRIYLVNSKGFYIFSPQRGVANDCP